MLEEIGCSIVCAIAVLIGMWNITYLIEANYVSKSFDFAIRCMNTFLEHVPNFSHGIALAVKRIQRLYTTISLDKKPNRELASMVLLLSLLIVSGFVGYIVGHGWFGVPVTWGLCYLLIAKYGQSSKRRQILCLTQEMPMVFRTLSTAISSGSSLTQAFFSVSQNASPSVAKAFSYAAFSLECGMCLSEVLDELEENLEVPGLNLALNALRISKRSGAAPSELLEEAAQIACDRVDLERELGVKTAQARMSAQVVALMPLIMTAFLIMFSPDYQQGLRSMQGFMSLMVAFGLDGLAWLIIKRVMGVILE